MKQLFLTLLCTLCSLSGFAQSFADVQKGGKFYFSVDEFVLFDNNPRYGRDAKSATALMLGYTFNKNLGLELSGASFGYEWKNNPRYLSLDLQSYSFSKDRVRVVTSIGLALVQGQTNENKEYLAPTFNVGASLQYLCSKNSYVGLNFRKMEGRVGFNAFMMGVSFGGYF